MKSSVSSLLRQPLGRVDFVFTCPGGYLGQAGCGPGFVSCTGAPTSWLLESFLLALLVPLPVIALLRMARPAHVPFDLRALARIVRTLDAA